MPQTRRALVITERYPPEEEGGAELSLADTLARLDPADWDVRVVALNSSAARDTNAADPVMRIAGNAGWPRGLSALHRRLAKMPHWLAKVVRPFLVAQIASKFIGQQREGRSRRLRQLVLHVLNRAHEAPPFDVDRDSLARPDEIDRRRIERLIEEFRPEVVHADNKDAIILASSLDLGTARLVAMVRDHRFFCAHAGQRMTVGETACTTCAFACIGAVNPLKRRLSVSELREVGEDRRSALARADLVLCTSRFLATELERMELGAPILAIGNPHPEPAGFAGISPHSAPRVLFAGALQTRKGPQILADCFARISAEIPDVTFDFAGRGPLEKEIIAAAARAGLAGRVRCLGFLDRAALFRAMAESWVVVSPTLWPEPFGRLPMEAAMVGRPTVASALGGHCETILDGVTGLLVPPADRDALAGALIGLLKDVRRAELMGAEACRYIGKQYAPAAVSAQLAAGWRLALEAVRP